MLFLRSFKVFLGIFISIFCVCRVFPGIFWVFQSFFWLFSISLIAGFLLVQGIKHKIMVLLKKYVQ